jgi:hypothetical protein
MKPSFTIKRSLLITAALLLSALPFQIPNAQAAIASHTITVATQPDAIIGTGPNIWVASCSGNAVTEINGTTNQVMQTLTDVSYGFNCPDAMVFDGTNLWVANKLGSTITELNVSTGNWIQTLTGPAILNPDALAFDGANIWVSDDSQEGDVGSFLSEFNASTGVLVRTITTPKNYRYVFGNPTGLAISGTSIWVSDLGNDWPIRFDIRTGAYLGKTSGGPPLNSSPDVTYHSGYIWSDSIGGSVVAEYKAINGVYVRSIKSGLNPNQLIFTGHILFVVSGSPVDCVKEYSSTGKLIRVVTKSSLSLGKGIAGIWAVGSELWVANYSRNSVTEFVL